MTPLLRPPLEHCQFPEKLAFIQNTLLSMHKRAEKKMHTINLCYTWSKTTSGKHPENKRIGYSKSNLSFFGYRQQFFWNNRKKLSQFGHVVRKGSLVTTVTAGFNTTKGQMTKMSQQKKNRIKQTQLKMNHYRECKYRHWSNLLRDGINWGSYLFTPPQFRFETTRQLPDC